MQEYNARIQECKNTIVQAYRHTQINCKYTRIQENDKIIQEDKEYNNTRIQEYMNPMQEYTHTRNANIQNNNAIIEYKETKIQ